MSFYAFSFGQMTSKNGHSILPKEGDWAIQMNGVPFINMAMDALDIMSDNGTNANDLINYVDGFNQVIVGKYFNSDDFATRYKVALNSTSKTFRSFGDNPSTGSGDELIQKRRDSYWELKLGYGHEYRRGHNRLQGFYGYEAMIGLFRGNSNNPNQYWSYEFDYEEMWQAGMGDYFQNRTTYGMGFSIGGRAFIGVEYFAAPKISLGAEFGWGFGLEMQGRGKEENTTVLWEYAMEPYTYDTGLVDINGDPILNYMLDPDGNYIMTNTLDENGDPVLNYLGVETDEDPISNSTERVFEFAVDNLSGAITATFHF